LLPPTGFQFFLATIYLLTLLVSSSVPARVRLEAIMVFAAAWGLLVLLVLFADPLYTHVGIRDQIWGGLS